MLLVALLLLSGWPAHAASALVESRGEGRFAVDGRGEAMVIDFRTDSVRTWKVKKARLYLFVVSGDSPAQLAVSTVTRGWSDESAASAAEGAFGKGGARETLCPVKALQQGWIEVEIPVDFVEAMAGGKSFGLAWLPGSVRINGRAPAYRQPYIMAEGDAAK